LKLGLVLPLALAACGQIDTSPSEPTSQQTGSLDVDLARGASGADVVALQDYLGQYGYFPNPTLARQYPAWRPATKQLPTRGLFDADTETAVRALQKSSGLPETGVADDATRALVKDTRCGVPDGMPELDRADKFATVARKFPSSTVTWRLNNTDIADLTLTQAKEAVRAAFSAWSVQTNLTFVEETTGEFANIGLAFTDLGAGTTTLAQTFVNLANPAIQINTQPIWSVATPVPATSSDLRTVLIHEIGHALGLNHSSFKSAVMYPSLPKGTSKSLDIDDTTAISALYDLWSQLPGGATDVASGANGATWIIGTNPNASGDASIFQRVGNTWVASNGGGFRIAVDPTGVPWVINKGGQIFKRTTNTASSGTWTQMPGTASDIGIGFDGTVWVISTFSVGNGNFQIRRFNGTTWDNDVGGAVRIAVGPDGVPWVVNAQKQIYRRTVNSTASGTYLQLPGAANDIGVGGANANGGRYAWIIGTTPVGNDFNIYVWNEQVGDPNDPFQPALFTWLPFGGGAVGITVGPNATPIVVNKAGGIFEPTK
jgi:peptidoglycan hydrolase-like protein with peptidoglycan-binding domain